MESNNIFVSFLFHTENVSYAFVYFDIKIRINLPVAIYMLKKHSAGPIL